MHSEEQIFANAAALPPTQRAAYLDAACPGQPERRARLESLLRCHDLTGFMEPPADVPTSLSTECPGDFIGRYKLLQTIGEGGFGTVWLAEQLEPVRRRVALKILKPGMDSRDIIARFEHERQALALMDHPNIAKVFDAGATEKGRPYFVMELVRGVRITDYCLQNHLATTDRLRLFITVCQAVHHAHQKGIIHRDLKPSNILVTLDDAGQPSPKVIDFGVAKAIQQSPLGDGTIHTQLQQIIGTPAYMSPEQAGLRPMDIDTRSDVYSLGVLLYELLTGNPPFDPNQLLAAGLDEMRRVIREVEPPKPSTRHTHPATTATTRPAAEKTKTFKRNSRVPPDLDWIVMKAMDKDRARRYESATGLAADLRRHLDNQPVLARPPARAYLLSRFVRRHKLAVATGIAVSLSLLAGLAAALWGKKQAEHEAERARLANDANKRNLHLASMADYASAVKALEEDFAATLKGERAAGYMGKSRWHEGVALLTRSLERNPENSAAALRLYDTIRYRGNAKKNWPLQELHYDGKNASKLKQERRAGAVFNPKGDTLAYISGDNKAQILDLRSRRSLGRPLIHQDHICHLSFSPDGSSIATASLDGTARIWNATTGDALTGPLRYQVPVTSESLHGQIGADAEMLKFFNAIVFAKFSADGQLLVTARLDGQVQLWNPTTGKPQGEPLHQNHSPTVLTTADLNPDGSRLLTTSAGKKGTVVIWDCLTRQLLGSFGPHKADIHTTQFSPDGSRIVTASMDRSARIWDAATGDAVGAPMQHEGIVRKATFSPDGTLMLTTCADQAILWNLRTEASVFKLGHQSAVEAARFNPDGSRIVTACDKSVQIWDVSSGRRIGEPMQHEDHVYHVDFSPNGTQLVTALENGKVVLWDTPYEPMCSVPLRVPSGGAGAKGVQCVSFSSDGTKLACSDLARNVWIWDWKSCRVVGDPVRCKVLMPLLVGTNAGIIDKGLTDGLPSSIGFGRTGLRIALTARHCDHARLWNASSRQPVQDLLRHQAPVVDTVFSPDGALVATTGADKSVILWDSTSGRRVAAPLMHDAIVNCVQFSSDSTLLATGSNGARIWKVASGELVGGPLHPGSRIMDVDFCPLGERLSTVDEECSVRIWNVETGTLSAGPMHQEKGLHAVTRFGSDGSTIVSSSIYGIRVWDANSGRPIMEPRRHEGFVSSDIRPAPDGSSLITFCPTIDDTIRIWQTVSAEMARRIESINPEVLEWCRHLAGLQFTEEGEFRLIPDRLRLAVLVRPMEQSGPWSDLATWFLALVHDRPLDLTSRFNSKQIAIQERDFGGEGTLESLDSALRYEPSLPLARLFLAAALDNEREGNRSMESRVSDRAAFLRRYDLDALAAGAGRTKTDELAALWVRAARHLLKLPPAAKVGLGPKATTAREEAGKAARKALELAPGLAAAEQILKELEGSQ